MPNIGVHCRKQSVCLGKPEAALPVGTDRRNSRKYSGHDAAVNCIGVVMDIWEKLYMQAKEEYYPQDITPFVHAHHVVCALESEDGRIYTGFCIVPFSSG